MRGGEGNCCGPRIGDPAPAGWSATRCANVARGDAPELGGGWVLFRDRPCPLGLRESESDGDESAGDGGPRGDCEGSSVERLKQLGVNTTHLDPGSCALGSGVR